MTRQDFILKIAKYFNDDMEEAANCAADYTDEEIANDCEEIIRDIDEDYRFAARERHYLECGY